jgi:hypothetical protein
MALVMMALPLMISFFMLIIVLVIMVVSSMDDFAGTLDHPFRVEPVLVCNVCMLMKPWFIKPLEIIK